MRTSHVVSRTARRVPTVSAGPVAKTAPPINKWGLVALAAGLAGLLAWVYWPTLAAMARRWANDPQYSHGYLVPLFAAAMLWLRRDMASADSARPSGWGLLAVAAGGALYLAGAYLYFEWLEAVSLLICLGGVVVLLGGSRALAWSWPAVAYLIFMVPLPHRVQTALAGPLRTLATKASTYALQTFGMPAVAEGNVIVLNDVRLGVEDACSGLAMLVTFVALAVAVAVVIRRPWPDRLALVASAVPVAIIINVTRITTAGVLHETAGPVVANAVFHDWAGWFMMPLALALYVLLVRVLARLFVDWDGELPKAAAFRRPTRAAGAPPPPTPAAAG